MKESAEIAVSGCIGRVTAIVLSTLLAIVMYMPENTAAAQRGRPGTARVQAATDSNIIRYEPNMRASSLAGRADSDLVEFSNGRRMRVGELRRLESWGQRARSTSRRQFPAALRAVPAATGKRVSNAGDLAAAMKLPDNETVVLPSGRRATVGMIKFVEPQVEKRLGRKLSTAPQRPGLSGPAIRLSKNPTEGQWKEILQKADNTVIESPDGIRITVGELKQELRSSTRQGRQGR